MKHHLSILLVALMSLGGSLLIVGHSQAAPPMASLDQIFDEANAALKMARDIDHANRIEPAEFASESEASSIELAFLVITPAPASIEEARSRVPQVAIASGYRRHAWLATYRMPAPAVSNDPLGLSWRGPRCYERLA